MNSSQSCRLIIDGGSYAIAVEALGSSGHEQALWVRAGQVWDGSDLRSEPGVWVEYQPDYMKTSLEGPVLLTPGVWKRLVRETNAKIRKQKRSIRKIRRRERNKQT